MIFCLREIVTIPESILCSWLEYKQTNITLALILAIFLGLSFVYSKDVLLRHICVLLPFLSSILHSFHRNTIEFSPNLLKNPVLIHYLVDRMQFNRDIPSSYAHCY